MLEARAEDGEARRLGVGQEATVVAAERAEVVPEGERRSEMDRVERTQGRGADTLRGIPQSLVEREPRQPVEDRVGVPCSAADSKSRSMDFHFGDHARNMARPASKLIAERQRLAFRNHELDERRRVEVQQLRQALDLVLADLPQRLADRDLTPTGRWRQREVGQVPLGHAGDLAFPRQSRDHVVVGVKRPKVRDRSAALGHLERLPVLDPPQPAGQVLAQLADSDALSHVALLVAHT